MSVDIVRYASADEVAVGLATRLADRLAALQAAGVEVPQVSLTGGRIATKAYQHLATLSDREDVDWTRVDWWWSDERWVPTGHADRNDAPTIAAIKAALPVPDERLHPMPGPDQGLDLDQAAAAYAAELGDRVFHVTLLGMGPDGHVASLFPGHPFTEAPAPVIGVRNSPKPPPERISATLPVINASAEVWFCVSGADKADATARALAGDPSLPASHVAGAEQTVWLVDADASAQVD